MSTTEIVYEVYAHGFPLEHCTSANFFMSAPLETLKRVFELAPEACQRIKREAAEVHTGCVLHFNRRTHFNMNSVTVVRSALVLSHPS